MAKRIGKSRKRHSKIKDGELLFVPLGGLGQIGRNMFALEYGDEMIVVDCGLMFPDEEMLGIDFVIPDASYLLERKDKIKGLILTHGHEDHIGALPFILPQLDVPVYGTKLTLGMVANKFLDAAPDYPLQMKEFEAGEVFKLGNNFTIKTISVCHSIPDGVGLAIDTPIGTVVHTGDFKLDPTPVDGKVTDYAAFAEFGRKGVLLMLSDSTNVERSGFTPSERVIGGTLERLFRQYRNKRIVIAAFASNLHRAQLVFNAAAAFNRKVALVGRSMIQNVKLARELGYITADDNLFVKAEDIEKMPAKKIVVFTTGSQGEPFSGLVLMSKGEHRHITLDSKDVVAVFASPIPGNEKLVSKTINQLFSCGCDVVYDKDQQVHVSGHASREELKMMLSLVKPKYFVPVHGEYRHLVRHANVAQEMGIPKRNIFLMQNGDLLRLNMHKASLKRFAAPAEGVLVDGMAIGEMQGSLLKERKDLSEEGLMVISIVLDSKGRLMTEPVIETMGFIHIKDAVVLREEILKVVRISLERARGKRQGDKDYLTSILKSRIRESLKKLGVAARSSPVIMPLISFVER